MNPEDIYHNQLLSQTKDDYRIPEMPTRQMRKQPIKRVYTDVKIFLKDESKLTERLIDYFDRYLTQLNKQGFKFEWIIVTDNEEEFYEDENITKFPTLLVNDENISGVSAIIKTLMNMIKFGADAQVPSTSVRPPQQAVKSAVEQNDETVRDYFLNSIHDEDNDDDLDEGTKFANDISSRIANMQESRKNGGMPTGTSNRKSVSFGSDLNQRPGPPKNKGRGRDYKVTTNFNNSAPVSTNMVDIIKFNKKSNKGASDEDSMLEKFYENQEETVL
jgi:glutaredoxin